MKFRVGQVVRIVRGARAGTITTVLSPPVHPWCSLDDCPGGCRHEHSAILAHRLDLQSLDGSGDLVGAPPSWLEPYHEPGDYTSLSELLRGVVPAGKVDA